MHDSLVPVQLLCMKGVRFVITTSLSICKSHSSCIAVDRRLEIGHSSYLSRLPHWIGKGGAKRSHFFLLVEMSIGIPRICLELERMSKNTRK